MGTDPDMETCEIGSYTDVTACDYVSNLVTILPPLKANSPRDKSCAYVGKCF